MRMRMCVCVNFFLEPVTVAMKVHYVLFSLLFKLSLKLSTSHQYDFFEKFVSRINNIISPCVCVSVSTTLCVHLYRVFKKRSFLLAEKVDVE